MLAKPTMSLNTSEPLAHEYYTSLNLVATLQSLAEPLTEKDACVFFATGKKFEFVGPLLERSEAPSERPLEITSELQEEIEEAAEQRRDVVYVSLGDGRDSHSKQVREQVCQVLQQDLGPETFVIPIPLVLLNAEPDCLGPLPENFRCFPNISDEVFEVAKPMLFVTDGNPRSFVEAIAVACPMLVCPYSPLVPP